MQEHLKKVSAAIDRLLASDRYPETVRPEYLHTAVLDYPQNGGKRLRPAILTWCCRLLGGKESAALYPAAAVEVFHNWTLVHDDIIDQDAVRRNRPTCHVALANETRGRFGLESEAAARTGRDFAILAGDLQQGWANHLMLCATDHGVSAKVVVGVMRRFQELANRELICGEALDVEFALRKLETIGLDEVREMLRGKTGALLRFCAEAGAMIALETDDPETPEVRKLGDFADAAGIAFQLRDDYLGIFGRGEQLGKAIGGDLREGKATGLLLTALRMASEGERQRLFRLLGRREYTPQDLDAVRRIMTDCGAAAAIEAEETELADRAKALLKEFPANVHRKCLLELVDYMITREK